MKYTAKSHLFVAIYFLVLASASWAQAAPGDAAAAPHDLPSRAQASDESGRSHELAPGEDPQNR
ncbi:MAG: hypothetical protein ABJA69_12140, partial [Acidobacteriaceae bacterium]